MVEMVLANMLPLSLNWTVCATVAGRIVNVLLVPAGISQSAMRLLFVLHVSPPGPWTLLLEMKIREPEVLVTVNESSVNEDGLAALPLHVTEVAASTG